MHKLGIGNSQKETKQLINIMIGDIQIKIVMRDFLHGIKDVLVAKLWKICMPNKERIDKYSIFNAIEGSGIIKTDKLDTYGHM